MASAEVSRVRAFVSLLLAIGLVGGLVGGAASPTGAPRVVDSRTIQLEQTVTVRDVSPEAKLLKMWVPIPSDTSWQRVLELSVVDAPKGWKLVTQADGRGDFLYAEAAGPFSGPVSVTVRCRVVREGVVASLEHATGPVDPALFASALDTAAPLMATDAQIARMAAEACGQERDIARQAALLMKAVAERADHYSKDATKPHCGRGSAQDCLEHGGGCCTDLHSLFIALARERGIPARLQYGYRVLDSKAGSSYDPGYRCWIEVFVPGSGWVPTDIVAADGASDAGGPQVGSLSATRVWLWEGRSFELSPPAAQGRIDTMICGWAEVDGKPVDPLPAADGAPSKLARTVRFSVVDRVRSEAAPTIPE